MLVMTSFRPSAMDEMKMNKHDVLEALKTNLQTHRETFIEAQQGYREEVIKELDRMLDDARSGKNIKRSITLPEPKDHTKEYEYAIEMLEMCTAVDIMISNIDFKQYVKDDWGWKADWSDTVSNYSKGR